MRLNYILYYKMKNYTTLSTVIINFLFVAIILCDVFESIGYRCVVKKKSRQCFTRHYITNFQHDSFIFYNILLVAQTKH